MKTFRYSKNILDRITRLIKILTSITIWVGLTLFSTVSWPNTEKDINLKIYFSNNIPYANFLINGIPTYAMIDTGSNFGFHLYESQINQIKDILRKLDSYRIVDAAGKVQENIEYVADFINVNGVELKNVKITPFKKWGMMIFGEEEQPDSPIAGLGLFKNKEIILDYISKTLTISDNLNFLSKNNFKEFFFQMSLDGIVINVEQSGEKYSMVLDTGSTASVIWKERLKSYQPVSCLTIDPNMDNKGCEATILSVKSENESLEYFGAVVVSGNFEHMGDIDGFIGNNFLENKKIIIDFKKNKILFYDN